MEYNTLMDDIFILCPTREEFDLLMQALEAEGYIWLSGHRPTERWTNDPWKNHESDTYVRLLGKRISTGGVSNLTNDNIRRTFNVHQILCNLPSQQKIIHPRLFK